MEDICRNQDCSADGDHAGWAGPEASGDATVAVNAPSMYPRINTVCADESRMLSYFRNVKQSAPASAAEVHTPLSIENIPDFS